MPKLPFTVEPDFRTRLRRLRDVGYTNMVAQRAREQRLLTNVAVACLIGAGFIGLIVAIFANG